MTFYEITKIIRFCTNVEIIEQDADVFPDRKNDKSLFIKSDIQYSDLIELSKYDDYKVCMITSKNNYLTIYICEVKM